MSSMLEKAIIDAKALKEAAMKNAEQAVVEKYSNKIKEAVDSLLEQDELADLGRMEDEDIGLAPEEGSESDIAKDLPLAGAEGEKLCPCPEEDEEIEIDFDDLAQQMRDPDNIESGGLDRESFADDELESELPLEEGEKYEEDLDEVNEELKNLEEECGLDHDHSEDEEMDDMGLYEQELKDLIEELSVDVDVVPSGYQGANKAECRYAEDVGLARAMDDNAEEEAEELEELKDQIELLEKSLKKLKEEKDGLLSENKNLKQFLVNFKDKLNEVNLINAKLLYKNRALDSDSLNERQKRALVEAISKAGSVNEAKTIYETLKSTVGSIPSRRENPKSLREAIERRSSILRPQRSGDEAPKQDPNLLRLQKLAGIK